MFVVAGVTAAMIIILSALNGIEELVEELFSSFDTDISIQPKEGKTISLDTIKLSDILEMEGVEYTSQVIEEDVWLNVEDRNTVATIKGVENTFSKMTMVDSMMYLGDFVLHEEGFNYAVLGYGVFSELRIPYREGTYPVINVNAPIRGRKLKKFKDRAFNSKPIMVRGAYSVNAELDVKYVVAPLAYCKALFDYENEVSAIEISLKDVYDPLEMKDNIKSLVGENYKIITRNEKNALVFQTNQSEKWATFLILLFVLLIAAFNIVASLTMLIIEKKKDIHVFRSMGVSESSLKRIFIFEGIMIYLMGAITGLAAGLVLVFLQINFGLIRIPGATIDFYPMKVIWTDILIVAASVMLVGFLFSNVLVRRLLKRFASIE